MQRVQGHEEAKERIIKESSTKEDNERSTKEGKESNNWLRCVPCAVRCIYCAVISFGLSVVGYARANVPRAW